MGCGASKEDIAEPRPMQSHGRNKLHLKGNEAVALKPNEIACALDGSECICSLYNNIPSAELNNSPSPPLVFIHSPDESLSSDEDEDDDEDIDPSFEFPSKLSVVEEDNNNASQTTALAALSGEAAVTDKELEERVEAILASDDGGSILPEESEECCALGVLSHSAILQALLSTGPVITQQFLGSDLSSARARHLAVISGPEPIRWETPLRKAEIIDLDEEPNAGESLMLENTPEQQENQSEQEPADAHALKVEEDSVASLTELQPKQIPKLLLSADRTPPLALELADSPSPNELDNHEDKRSKSSLVTEHCEDGTPTPATKSSADSGWRSPHRDLPMDPDIENIDLLESPELDSQQLPLMSMLDCHGIHMDKKDLISPSLRLIS